MERFVVLLQRALFASVPIVGVLWVFSVPDRLGIAFTFQQVVGVVLGLAMGAAFLKYPYGEGRKAGALEVTLAVVSFASWFWMAYNFEDWLMSSADRTLDMWVPGVFAILLMMEALRKACGRVITILVWVIIVYAYFGDYLPGALEAEVYPPTKTVLYLYGDNNGIPGLVLRVVTQIVLPFIILGKLMEVTGASAFFTDMAMALMGHFRGGPAKVAVVASSAFGTISGSAVANIMSTGIVTIPMMKRTGYSSHYAAAIEAVASNGGQIAPPVMGATAFIIAEFLDLSYIEVVIAAAVPAFLYYLVLFLQVDAIAVRFGLRGLPRDELPRVMAVLNQGWVFLLPIVVLLYFLFYKAYNAGLSAMYAGCALLALVVLIELLSAEVVATVGAAIVSALIGDLLNSHLLGMNWVPVVVVFAAAPVVYAVIRYYRANPDQRPVLVRGIARNTRPITWIVLGAGVPLAIDSFGPTAGFGAPWIGLAGTALAVYGIGTLSRPTRAEWVDFIFGSGENLTPLILIAGAAGVVIGVLNSTGLAFQLSIILADLGESAGILAMLLLTAFVSIILGMGMPTAAVYIVLATVVAPALVEMGIQPLPAHLFLFYFGLLSLLTPPVAVASMVAAGLAGSDMWRTGIIGVQLAAAAYLLPFLWVFNPALILQGTIPAIIYVVTTATCAGFLICEAIMSWGRGGAMSRLLGVVYFAATLVVGGSTLWVGAESALNLIVAAVGAGTVYLARRTAKPAVGQPHPAE